jgi:hypothetical protein
MRHSIQAAALVIMAQMVVCASLPATAAPIVADPTMRSATPNQLTTVRYHHWRRYRYGYAYHSGIRGCVENEGHRRWTPCDGGS